MSIIRGLCLLLVGGIFVAAQPPRPAPQQSNLTPSDLCTVGGVVVKSTTGEGIKRATVQLTPLGPAHQTYSALTESSGSFTIRDLPPGRYVISAWSKGYAEQTLGRSKGGGRAKILELTPGKNLSGIALRLVPPGIITGTVYDEEGDPVTLAEVKALLVTGAAGNRHVREAGSGQTNDLGEYRIWGLSSGKYLVAVTYKPPQTISGPPSDEVYLPTFHPSTPDTSQASLVEVEPGAEVSGIDVDLTQAHAVTVQGRVMVDGSAKSLRGVNVSLDPRTSEGGYSSSHYVGSVKDDAGDFEIRDVPPGPYNLSAFWNDGKRELYGMLPLEVSSANLEGVTFVLGTPLTLLGRFRVEGNKPFDFTSLHLWLQPLEGTVGSGYTEIKPDGTFVVRNVYDGSYRVRVGGYPEGYYLKSVQEGWSEIRESGLTISHGQPPSHLEIVLSPEGGRVNGTVLKEQQPVSGAWVVLVPDASHRDREEMYGMEVTDSSGRFSLSGLPPGDFELFAWEPVQGIYYTDPDFLKAFEGRGTPVHIEGGQVQAVQLEVIPSEEQLR